MLCTHCQHPNPPGAKFCNACGTKLEIICSACQHVNLPESRFCNQCGASLVAQSSTSVSSSQVQGVSVLSSPSPQQAPASYTPPHLAERIQAEREAMEARGVSDGERKSITALFVDIKGSTDLIAELDPEEARAILDPTLQLMMDAVHRYEGYVAQALARIIHEDAGRNGSPLLKSEAVNTFGLFAKERADGRVYYTTRAGFPSDRPSNGGF